MRRAALRAATSGIAVLGAVAAIALSGLPQPGHTPAGAAGPGVPRYAVALGQRYQGGQAASVKDMVTGKILGTVAVPVAGSALEWVAAASDDRAFVLADQSGALVIWFYLLHLAASGKPGRLTQLDVPPLHDSQI